MLSISTARSFKRISAEWGRLYKITPEVSPFLNPAAMSLCVRYFYPYYLAKRCRPLFLLFQESDSVRAIAPMLRYSNGRMELFGFANGFNESGMLFDSVDILPECLRLMKERYTNVELLKIDERSPLAKLAPSDAIATSNAEIRFGADFDEYFKGLSKSARQNIRTAYNRLSTDGLPIDLQVFSRGGYGLPLNDIINLYVLRHEKKYAVKTGVLKKWFLKTQSFATRLYLQSPNAMTFVLYINGSMAAFMSGLSDSGRLIIPRLSIDESFRRYSPGMLLVTEAIKYLIKSTDINVLDLSQGDEPYKYNLGATEHFSYRYRL